MYDFQYKYENTKFVKVDGKSPELIFKDIDGNVVERVQIGDMTRDELNVLMAQTRFKQIEPKTKVGHGKRQEQAKDEL